jgi:hypothetical protein
MDLNLKTFVGRLIVVLAIIVGAVNLDWYLALEPTTAEVIRSEGPCYRRNKATVCDFQVRYVTGTGSTVVTTFGAPRQLTVGKPLAGLYHPDAPAQFHLQDTTVWMRLPIIMLVIGLACWVTGWHELRRKAAPSDADAATANWVGRAYRRVAEARTPRQSGSVSEPARTRSSRSPG